MFRKLIARMVGERNAQRYRFLRRLVKTGSVGTQMRHGLGQSVPLPELGRLCMTDKGDDAHTFHGESYLDIYARYFEPMRQREDLSLLEIGVRYGHSLKMWKAYFPHARVRGIDIDPDCTQYEEDRLHVAIGSQDDPEFLKACFPDIPEFDIIIDDGSHVNHMTLTSFATLFPHRLRSGGIYVMEDLRNSYLRIQTDYNVYEEWRGMVHNDPSKVTDNNRADMDRFFAERIRGMDFFEGDIRAIHFWPMMCVILKV